MSGQPMAPGCPGVAVSPDLCQRLLAIVHAIFTEVRHQLTSDLSADCLQAARIGLWQAGEHLRRLPSPDRCRYCATVVRHAVWRLLKPQLRSAAMVFRWEDSPDPEVAQGEFVDCDGKPPEACMEEAGLLDVPLDEAWVAALRSLPAREFQALELHCVDDLQGVKLGEAMDLPSDTARRTLNKAITRVRAAPGVAPQSVASGNEEGGATPVCIWARRRSHGKSERMRSRFAHTHAL